MSQIVIDKTCLIAFSTVSGFLDAEKILKITGDIDGIVDAFGPKASCHGRLFDLTGAKVGPPDAISALGAMTVDPTRLPLRANRVAYFGASPLLKLQLKRLCAFAPRLAVFDDRRSAYAWAVGGRGE